VESVSIVLSRIQINPFSRKAMMLAADTTELHRELYRLFEKENAGRILFRVDSDEAGPTVLVQSAIQPDWDRFGLSIPDLRSAPNSKPIEITPPVGAELSFRLMARPTRVGSTGKGNRRGPRRDLRTDEERLEWLRRKGEIAGFRVTMCGLTILSLTAIKSDVGFRSKGGSFAAVRFDGELVVADTDKLRSAVEAGIGTQKAFGFGLLSLGRSI
jgi:CRISPR-associated protein Cas6/Cse3/CasE subtype I-E